MKTSGSKVLFDCIKDDVNASCITDVGAALEAARKDDIPQTFIHMTDMLPSVFTLAGQHLPMFLEFLWLQASRDPAVWQAMIAPYHRYQEFFAGLVARGTADGSFKPVDPQVAGQAIVSMAVGLLLQGSLDPQGADWPKVARESIQIIIDSISHNIKAEEE